MMDVVNGQDLMKLVVPWLHLACLCGALHTVACTSSPPTHTARYCLLNVYQVHSTTYELPTSLYTTRPPSETIICPKPENIY